MRARALWLMLPLLLCGIEAAHAIANALVGSPDGDGELFAAASSGQRLVPLALVAALAAALVGAAKTVSRRGAPLQPWLFAALPPLLFVLLELAEAGADHHAVSLRLFAEPATALGLVLQAPFALLAFALARLLLVAAAAVVHALGRAAALHGLVGAEGSPRPASSRARIAPTGRAGCGRAPPIVAVRLAL